MEEDVLSGDNISLSREDFLQFHVGDAIWIYVSPCLIVIGTFGNTLSIVVLLRKAMRTSTTMFYLTALSFGDLVALYTGLMRYWIFKAFKEDIRHISQFGCKLHAFVVYSVLDFTVWTLVSVTIDRCLSVSVPFKAKRICSIKRSRIVLIVMLCLITLKNMHFFWNLNLVYTWEFRCDANTPTAQNFLRYIWPWIDFCTFCIIPFSIMIGCNIKIIYKMLASQRKLDAHSGLFPQNPSTVRFQSQVSNPGPSAVANVSGQSAPKTSTSTVDSNVNVRRISSLTVMLLTTNCVFLITTSPIQAFLIGEEHWYADRSPEDNAWHNFWWAVVNMLQYLNNAIHFFLYCLTGPRFRQELRALFRRSHRVSHSEYSNNND